MPKGFPASKTALRQHLGVLVPPGAKRFPNTDTLLPDGVTVRSSRGVQIEFMYEGARCTETLRGTPTVQHVLDAAAKRDRVIKAIGLGLFRYRDEFPTSKRTLADEVLAPKNAIPTVGEALEEWLSTRENTVGENAFKDYSKDVKFQLKPLPLHYTQAITTTTECQLPGILQDLRADRLSDVHINHIRTWLLARPVSVKRVINIMTPLRGALARLAEKGVIATDPFTRVRPLKNHQARKLNDEPSPAHLLDDAPPIDDISSFAGEDGLPDPFTPEEVDAICAQLSGPFLNQIVFWMWTGLRTGELIGLRWADINRETNQVCIRRSVSRGVLKRPKSGQTRWVKLLEPARQALDAQFKHSGDANTWVFPNPWTGERWANESKIRTRFMKALNSAGVRYRRPYQCRHTYASTLLSSGESPLFVANQMGHKDWSMIIRVYGRWIEGVDTQVGQRVAGIHGEKWKALSSFLEANQLADSAPHADEVASSEANVGDESEGRFDVPIATTMRQQKEKRSKPA